MSLQEVILSFSTLIIGIILGYLGYRYQVLQDKVKIKRERILAKISVIENALSMLLEMENSLRLGLQLNTYGRERDAKWDEIDNEIAIISPLIEKYEGPGLPGLSSSENAIAEKLFNLSDEDMTKLSKILTTDEKKLQELTVFIRKLDNIAKAYEADKEKFTKFKELRLVEKAKTLREEAKPQEAYFGRMMKQNLKRLSELTVEINSSDFETQSLLVDPSGQLKEYFSSLAGILFSDINRVLSDQNYQSDISKDKRSELKLKIRALLEKKVDKM